MGRWEQRKREDKRPVDSAEPSQLSNSEQWQTNTIRTKAFTTEYVSTLRNTLPISTNASQVLPRPKETENNEVKRNLIRLIADWSVTNFSRMLPHLRWKPPCSCRDLGLGLRYQGCLCAFWKRQIFVPCPLSLRSFLAKRHPGGDRSLRPLGSWAFGF